MNRRSFLNRSLLAGAALSTGKLFGLASEPDAGLAAKLKFSLKIGMCQFGNTVEEKFKIIQDLGYDGIELNSPGGLNKQECLEASKKIGLPIHGVVDSIHWNVPFSDPSEEVRAKALEGLKTAIRDSHLCGGDAVLVVPAVVKGEVTQELARERSMAVIKEAFPLAQELKIRILFENVWNGFLYDAAGSNNQSADALAKYIDDYQTPIVGSYFDIGNHQKFGKPAEWIRTLGARIGKLDVKDWGVKNGFCKIGEGDVDWASVREALKEIKYQGWATAEVAGGDAKVCADVLARMKKVMLGA